MKSSKAFLIAALLFLQSPSIYSQTNIDSILSVITQSEEFPYLLTLYQQSQIEYTDSLTAYYLREPLMDENLAVFKAKYVEQIEPLKSYLQHLIDSLHLETNLLRKASEHQESYGKVYPKPAFEFKEAQKKLTALSYNSHIDSLLNLKAQRILDPDILAYFLWDKERRNILSQLPARKLYQQTFDEFTASYSPIIKYKVRKLIVDRSQ